MCSIQIFIKLGVEAWIFLFTDNYILKGNFIKTEVVFWHFALHCRLLDFAALIIL